MKISERDKSLIMVILGFAILFSAWYFGYRPIKEKNLAVKLENAALDGQIQALGEIASNQDQYILDTRNLKRDMDDILVHFPVDITSEDIILYVKDLEMNNDAYISSTSMPVATVVDITPQLEPDVLSQHEDITGAVTANAFINDGSIPDTANMLFSKIVSDVSFDVGYTGLKNMISEITTDKNRKSIDKVSVVFNENTGNLSCSMTINYFFLSGTGKEYIQPSISGTAHGKGSIFGSLKTTDEPEE